LFETMPPRCFPWVLLLVGGLLTGCDSTSPPPPQQFPDLLQRGETWTYDVRFTEQPVNSSDVDTVFSARVRMEVARTGVRLGEQAGLVELAVFPPSNSDSADRTWYQQSPDSLVEVAYTTPPQVGGTLPLGRPKAASFSRRAQGLTRLPMLVRRHLSAARRSASRDTVIRADSRIVLQTPLESGATWTSFRDPFLSVRTVTGDSTLSTPAGRFDAVEIQTSLPDLAPSLHWADYVAPAGLAKRVVTDTVERRDDTGTQVTQAVTREVYTLTDYQD
jgi:hypothetical protein